MHISNSKKKHKKIVLIVLSILILPWIAFFIFLDPIATMVLEKNLESAFKANADVKKLHIGLLKPKLTIGSITIDNKDDPYTYLLQSSSIKLSFQVKPFLDQKLISMPEVIFDNINFYVDKPPNKISTNTPPRSKEASENTSKDESSSNNKLSAVTDILSVINIDDVLAKYTTIRNIKEFSNSLNGFQENTTQILSDIAGSISSLQSEYTSVLNNLQSVTDIKSLNNNISEVQSLINEGNEIITALHKTQNNAKKYSVLALDYAQNLREDIQKDTENALADLSNPQQLGLELAKSIARDIIKEKLGKNQKLMNKLLDAVNNFNPNFSDTEKKANKKEEKKKSPLNFRVGFFKLGIGYQSKYSVLLQSKNITNKIYTSMKPTLFSLTAADNTGIQVNGNGGITLYPNATTIFFIDANFSMPATITSNNGINLIELNNIDGTIAGNTSLKLHDSQNGTISASLNYLDTDTTPINGDFGPHIANAIDNNNPIDIIVNANIINNNIETLKIQSSFIKKMATAIAEMLKAQLDLILAGLKTQLEEEANAQAEALLNTLSKQLNGVADSINYQIDNLDEIEDNAKNLISTIKEDGADILKEEAMRHAETVKKAAEEEAMRHAETVKKAAEEKAKRHAEKATKKVKDALKLSF